MTSGRISSVVWSCDVNLPVLLAVSGSVMLLGLLSDVVPPRYVLAGDSVIGDGVMVIL